MEATSSRVACHRLDQSQTGGAHSHVGERVTHRGPLKVERSGKWRVWVGIRHDLERRFALRERHGGIGAVLVARRPHYHHWAVAHEVPEAACGKNDGPSPRGVSIPGGERENTTATTYTAIQPNSWAPVLRKVSMRTRCSASCRDLQWAL
jgi:hypothetical protein